MQSVIISTVWCWQKVRQADQTDMMENPELNPHIYGQLFFDTSAKKMQWRNNRLFKKQR